jgi:menaquinone-dependent protoporphyrinogen IX oxidase
MERWLYNQDKITSIILPKDGTVNYYRKILTLKEANHYLDLLLQNILWQNDEANIFGKHITTKRKIAWYGALIICILIQIRPNKH